MKLKVNTRTKGQKLEAGFIPAIAYNKEQNLSLSVERKVFDKIFREKGISGVFDLVLDTQTFPALVKTVQMDKRRREAIHIDFFLVSAGEEIKVSIPVTTTGRAKGEIEGGLVDIVHFTVNVIAKDTKSIPSEIIVDVTKLNIGDHVTAGQLKLPKNVVLDMDESINIISVLPPRLTAEELKEQKEAAQLAGHVASGEISADEAEAILEGETTLDEAKEHHEEAKKAATIEGTEGKNMDKDNHRAEENRSTSGQKNN